MTSLGGTLLVILAVQSFKRTIETGLCNGVRLSQAWGLGFLK